MASAQPPSAAREIREAPPAWAERPPSELPQAQEQAQSPAAPRREQKREPSPDGREPPAARGPSSGGLPEAARARSSGGREPGPSLAAQPPVRGRAQSSGAGSWPEPGQPPESGPQASQPQSRSPARKSAAESPQRSRPRGALPIPSAVARSATYPGRIPDPGSGIRPASAQFQNELRPDRSHPPAAHHRTDLFQAQSSEAEDPWRGHSGRLIEAC